VLLALLGVLAVRAAPGHPWLCALALLAALLPVSELAVGVVNYVLTLFLPPRTLPKPAFRDGIPADCATFVVMPSMLVRPQSAASLLERLEIHYLANPDPPLYFALLTDFADAPVEHRPEDGTYVKAALDGVAELNRRHAAGGPPRFFLFHRRRQWNPAEGCWMGCERKRGKLAEFNRLLRGDRATSYHVCSTDPADLPRVRYVITLDLETQLPRDTARRLIGTLAHPLNRAQIDPQQRRVVAGYGVLQPRISLHIPAANRSRFTRIYATSAGIDPYSAAVSDIYQDLFGAGTFTGKGIYDVDAFEAAVGHTFPDNYILSHDLIEGNYARCGLVTDIELFEDFPARYNAYARREHRWVRGDWQLLPWLGRRVPVGQVCNDLPPPSAGEGRGGEQALPRGGGREKESCPTMPNPLPALERWKILDNLRRSLVPPVLVLWLLLGWSVLPLEGWVVTVLAGAVLALPLLLQVFGTLVHLVRDRSLTPLRDFQGSAPATLGQVVLGAAFLLNQAYLAVDAVARTLLRLWFTRRRLLEWETAAVAERRLGTGLRDFVFCMVQTPLLAVGMALLVGAVRPEALPAAGCFLALWFVSPLVAFWVSQSPRVREKPLCDAERRELHRVARRVWGIFETFVGDGDHWLPPDNYQEEPRGQLAHRTSPTNQGLLLVSTLAAHDLGYLGLPTLLERLEKTCDTLERLERYRGHFYNWYDTLTLQPLQPAYVSTVDSGNLLGSLLTLVHGLDDKVHEPVVGPALKEGLIDTLGVLAECLHGFHPGHDAEAGACYRDLEALVADLARRLQEEPTDLPSWAYWLEGVDGLADRLGAPARRLVGLAHRPPADLDLWAARFAGQVRDGRPTWRRWRRGWGCWPSRRRRSAAKPAPAGGRTRPGAGRPSRAS
jgi:cyclic beta-1,2-glucan synthetase